MNRPLPPCLRLDTYEHQRPTGPDTLGPPVRSRLNDVHDYFRTVIDELDELIANGDDEVDLRSMRTHLTALACRQYCADLVSHHLREDNDLFPSLAAANPQLTGVLDRLEAEHTDIHQGIRLAYAHSLTTETPADRAELATLIRALAGIVESHFRYEEDELGHAMNSTKRVSGETQPPDNSNRSR